MHWQKIAKKLKRLRRVFLDSEQRYDFDGTFVPHNEESIRLQLFARVLRALKMACFYRLQHIFATRSLWIAI